MSYRSHVDTDRESLSETQNDRSPDTRAVYAWLGRDKVGIEGFIAMPTAYGIMPLLAADEQRARGMEPDALLAARLRDCGPARLVKFTRCETLAETGP